MIHLAMLGLALAAVNFVAIGTICVLVWRK